MAAGRIKGITVEINGDTTGLSKALSGVNKEIRSTQSQLRDVEKLLKLDPHNTELMAQKHRLLGQAVSETKEKLETLKAAQEQANEALRNGTISQEQYDGLQREIIETENELRRLEEQANQSATALQKISATGERLKTAGDKISSAGTKLLPVTGVVAGLGTAAVKTAADFDSAMSQVAAVSGATGSDLDALREKAREMGSKTKFSASEAAEAMNYMAMAGWKTEDMLSGIEGVMNLAAASGEDLATTSDIVTDALTAFGMTAQDSGHFADILAAASSNANTNVSMMGETFKYCAPIAGALGFSAEDTAEAIGLMANAGIKSSQAGTALRTVMNNLAGEVKLSGAAFGEVAIATTNADGSMRGLSDILADCRAAFNQMTESEKAQAAETLVGKNAMSGFLALMNAGEGDITKLSNAIANCDGTAESMASTMQDNLAGQLTILKSQLEELAISFGELLMPAIRTVVGWVQSFVDWLNGMDEGTRKAILTVTLLAAALGPVLIVIGKVVSAVGTILAIVPKLAAAMGAVKTAFSALSTVMMANPIALVIAAVAALVAAFIYLWNNCEGFREFWISLWENIKEVAVAVWETLKEFFAAAWEAISATAQTVWNGVKNFFSGLWEGIKSIFQTVMDAIRTIITTYFEIYKATIVTVLTAIKTVFATIWNAIKTVVTTVVTAIQTFLITAWNVIKTVITTVLNAIKTVFSTVWNGIKTVVITIVNGIRSTITTVWNSIKTTVSTVVNAIKTAVSAAFTAMWNGIKVTVTGIYNTIKGGFDKAVSFIKGLASSAFSWGADIINGIVNGIRSCIGKIADAAGEVAEKIKSFLHFSVPDEGPLTDYEKWMPDFMAGLAKGIEKSRGLVEKAVSDVAADMVISPQVAAVQMAGGGFYGGGSVTDGAVASILSGIREMVESLSVQGGGMISIPVYLGTTLLDEVIVNAQKRQNLRSGGR